MQRKIYNMKKYCIILSGGMDSVTMLYEYKDIIGLALTFDYGSNHNKKEIRYAKYHCSKLGIPQIIIPLKFIGKYFESSLLKGADAIPEGNYTDENMKSTVVPFRNGIMLAVAAGLAESKRMDGIMIANHAGDHAIYPDCRPGFIEAINEAIRLGTYKNLTIFAPYTEITKGEIACKGKSLGIDYSKTWSCYKGGAKHCGKCGTCVERKEALQFAGIEDNTQYE